MHGSCGVERWLHIEGEDHIGIHMYLELICFTHSTTPGGNWNRVEYEGIMRMRILYGVYRGITSTHPIYGFRERTPEVCGCVLEYPYTQPETHLGEGLSLARLLRINFAKPASGEREGVAWRRKHEK